MLRMGRPAVCAPARLPALRLTLVLASRARASLSISFSSSSMSTGSGRAGLVSGFVSISPGRSRRGSSRGSTRTPSAACAASSSFS
jgi:hypothetical protein